MKIYSYKILLTSLALFLVLLLLAGCHDVPNSASTKEDAINGPQKTASENNIKISVQGEEYVFQTKGNISPGRILTAPGQEGFYWALPQDIDGSEPGEITEPAVIHYTPYKSNKTIDPQQAKVIYRLPLQDISKTGADPGALRLTGLKLRGKWLFYSFSSVIKGTPQPAYTALGAVDITLAYPNARLIFRGHDTGGGQMAWTADENYVVWQQADPRGDGIYDATTVLYDLKTGRQQELPLAKDQFVTTLQLAGNTLVYGSATDVSNLKLPAPGADKLVNGARWLPATAFDQALPVIQQKFNGKIYLPAVIDQAPFYQVQVTADQDSYSVTFDASSHPVPLNATEDERRQLGVDPSLAQTLGTIKVSKKFPQGPGPFPAGETFTLNFGLRQLEAHFIASSKDVPATVWWRDGKDGSWLYSISNFDRIWEGPDDPGLIKAVHAELPPDGKLVSGAGGRVNVSLVPDHRGTDVSILKDGQWIKLGGYKFDAIKGARVLVMETALGGD